MPTSGDVVAVDLGTAVGREAGYLHPALVVTAQRLLDAVRRVLAEIREVLGLLLDVPG